MISFPAASAHVCLGPFILDPARAIAARVVITRTDPALLRMLFGRENILFARKASGTAGTLGVRRTLVRRDFPDVTPYVEL